MIGNNAISTMDENVMSNIRFKPRLNGLVRVLRLVGLSCDCLSVFRSVPVVLFVVNPRARRF